MKLTYNIQDKPKFGSLLVFAFQQLLAILAATIAMTTPMMYIANTTFAALSGKNIAANKAMIGSFAPHVRNGVTRMETIRSFSESKARAPMIAGTPQPKPIISGITPLPVRPQRRIIGSMMKAIRAI